MAIPASEFCNILDVHWESGPNEGLPVVRLTDYGTSVVRGGAIYSRRDFSLRFGKQTIGMQDAPMFVTLERGIPIFDQLASGYPLAQVWIDCFGFDPNGVEEACWRGGGLVTGGTMNKGGKERIVEIRTSSVKSLTQRSLGLVAGARCGNRFGGVYCGYDRSNITFTGTVIGTNFGGAPGHVAVDFDGTVPDLLDEKWRNGDLTVAGGRVQIRKSLGPLSAGGVDAQAVFDTHHLAYPPSWPGSPIVIRQGCEKTERRCGKLGNISRFRAIGKSMPTRQPQFEDPAS